MSYELTIHRVGRLAGVPHRGRPSEEADRAATELLFRRQADHLRNTKAFITANKKILKIMRDRDPDAAELHDQSFEDEDGVIDVLSVDGGRADAADSQAPFLALMPSRRVRCSVSGIDWNVRIRATVTACALQCNGGFTKLWWTFEGVPGDPTPERRPTEPQAAEFLQMTNEMAETAAPLLYDAYRVALAKVGKARKFPLLDQQIRVCMTDNDDRELGVLFDAMSFQKLQPSQIRVSKKPELAPARQALSEFDHFVRKLARIKKDPSDKQVHLAKDVPGLRGIVYSKDDARLGPCAAGIARRLGSRSGYWFLSPDLQEEAKKEPYLRAISAARPLSAKIAHDMARVLDPA